MTTQAKGVDYTDCAVASADRGKAMEEASDPVAFPELIFGTAGPIGADMDNITKVLEEHLLTMGYKSIHIKLTSEMLRFKAEVEKKENDGRFAEYWWKMDYANDLRRIYKSPDTLGRIAIDAIRRCRGAINGDPKKPLRNTAYIVRQLKHPAEVHLLRKVYGQNFVLISAYAPEDSRKRKLIEDIRSTEPTQASQSDIEHKVAKLIERDASEVGERSGQQLRDTYHLADVFVDGSAIDEMRKGLLRFIHAFFGRTDITPRKDEYGMYAAKSASLRSADLSRQVGVAIFSNEGELICQGCNEVPKALGGTYWDGEEPDHRDIKKGFDPNDRLKREVLRDLIERLRLAGHLSDLIKKYGSDAEIVQHLITKTDKDSIQKDGPLSDSWLMDLTEYGRVIHAEMSAICDAARLGKSVKSGILFGTTFPCHNCTKHIIAAGISRVVFMEPYPKSRAKELHDDEMELESNKDPKRVSFVPFLGISPFRYRNIFQKGRRKDSDGSARKWLQSPPRPMIDIDFPSYTTTGEMWALAPLLGGAEPVDDPKHV